jgi:hypothetical protein
MVQYTSMLQGGYHSQGLQIEMLEIIMSFRHFIISYQPQITGLVLSPVTLKVQ